MVIKTMAIPYVHYDRCTGCGGCAAVYPQFFVMRDGLPWLMNHELFVEQRDAGVGRVCPFGAITIE